MSHLLRSADRSGVTELLRSRDRVDDTHCSDPSECRDDFLPSGQSDEVNMTASDPSDEVKNKLAYARFRMKYAQAKKRYGTPINPVLEGLGRIFNLGVILWEATRTPDQERAEGSATRARNMWDALARQVAIRTHFKTH
jgi:hypothetical protein